MKRWLTLIGSALCIASAYFFISRLSAQWETIRQLHVDCRLLGAAAAATALYVATYLSSAGSWKLSLNVCGADVSLAAATRINAVAQIGKYLPGNVGQHIGRVVLAKRAGLPAPATIASLLLDMVAVMIAAGIASLLMLDVVIDVFERHFPLDSLQLTAILLALVAGAGILVALALRMPRVRDTLLPRVSGTVTAWLGSDNRTRVAGAIGCHLASFVAGSVGLACVALALSPTTIDATVYPILLGAYAASWLCGFLIPGAPAGLGIRETVLVLSLSPLLGAPQAATLTLILRVMTTVGDAFAFLIGLAWSGLTAGRSNPRTG